MDIEAAYKKYSMAVLKFCAKLLKASIHNPDVQDLASDVWTKASAKWDTYVESKSNVYTWLCQIARNKNIDNYRKHSKMVIKDNTCIENSASYACASPSSILETNEYALSILNALPEHLYDIYCLKLAGLSVKEIAAHKNTSIYTIYSRLNEIKKYIS